MSKSKRRDELKKRWPKGSPAPNDYCAWHEWAEAQHLHGLKQSNCTDCGRYRFPQQLTSLGNCTDRTDCTMSVKRYGKLKLAQL